MNCRGLVVTGTDTEVGKTHVSSLLLKQMVESGLRVGAYKPVCSGAEQAEGKSPVWDDVERLWKSLNGRFEREKISPQRFLAPTAPPRAAQLEGKRVDELLIDSGRLWWEQEVDWLLIEGVGGILAPVSSGQNVAELACQWGYPLLIVSRLGLGTLNHTLLTIEAAERRNLRVAGIVFNEISPPKSDLSRQYNEEDLRRLTNVPILGRVAYQGDSLIGFSGERIDWNWEELFDFSTKIG